MASQIAGVSIVCSAVCSGADQRKHRSSASRAFVRGIHRWRVDSPHKGSVTWKMFPFDDVIMCKINHFHVTRELGDYFVCWSYIFYWWILWVGDPKEKNELDKYIEIKHYSSQFTIAAWWSSWTFKNNTQVACHCNKLVWLSYFRFPL